RATEVRQVAAKPSRSIGNAARKLSAVHTSAPLNRNLLAKLNSIIDFQRNFRAWRQGLYTHRPEPPRIGQNAPNSDCRWPIASTLASVGGPNRPDRDPR